MADESDEWIEVAEAARRLGIGEATVYRLINDGSLNAARFPVRIRRGDLDVCIDRCRIKPGQLAALDPNAARRPRPGTVGPMTRRGAPDRRFGRRYPPH